MFSITIMLAKVFFAEAKKLVSGEKKSPVIVKVSPNSQGDGWNDRY